MANRTHKLIVCVDTYREHSDPPLRGVRVLDEYTLKVAGEAPVGAYDGEKAAVIAAVEDYYRRGSRRNIGPEEAT